MAQEFLVLRRTGNPTIEDFLVLRRNGGEDFLVLRDPPPFFPGEDSVVRYLLQFNDNQKLVVKA